MAVPAALTTAAGRSAATGQYGLPPLTPEEESSFLDSIGSQTIASFGALGNFLDTPGSMVRDTLGSFAGFGTGPWDNLASPFTSNNRLGGRDFLEQAGWLGPNQEGLDWGDVAGFGFEVLTDPLTYMTFGASALGKGGQLAKRAGVFDDLVKRASPGLGKRAGRMRTTLGDIISHADDAQRADLDVAARGMGFGSLEDAYRAHGNDPLGGLVGFGLPFGEPMGVLGRSNKLNAPVELSQDALRVGPERSRVLGEMESAFGRDEALAGIQLHDEYAKKWAQGTGGSLDDYYSQLNFRSGSAADVGQEALFQGETSPVPMFYSKMSKVIDEKVGGKVSKNQLLATLKNNGVKPEEMEWSNLDDLFDGVDSVSKDELQKFIEVASVRPEDIQVVEKQRGGMPELNWSNSEDGLSSTITLSSRFDDLSYTAYRGDSGEWRFNVADEAGADRTADSWAGYKSFESLQEAQDFLKSKVEQNPHNYREDATQYGDEYATKLGDDLENYREILLKLPDEWAGPEPYRSGHWNEKNVLAHIRLQDVPDNGDGLKRLLVDEIQSDWHQAGRKEGYKEPGSSLDNALDSLQQIGFGSTSRPPNAPFKKTWHELAFKKVLHDAVQQGYDEVLWTTGHQQAYRYTGNPSDKMIKGMSGFYDELLPSFVRKYTKKAGGKVEMSGSDTAFDDAIESTISQIFEDEGYLRGDTLYLAKTGFVTEHGRPPRNVDEIMQGFEYALKSGEIDKSIQRYSQFSSNDRAQDIEWLRTTTSLHAQQAMHDASRSAFHKLKITPELRRQILSEGQPLFQPGKGAVEFFGDNKRAVITAFAGRDISTLAHESGHVFRRWLGDMDPSLLKRAENLYGVKDGEWTKAHEEDFATGFERYLREGYAPTAALKGVFQRFKDWLSQIYQNLVGSPLENEISPEMRQLFGDMLSPKQATDQMPMSIADRLAGGMDKVGAAARFGNIPGTDYSPGRHMAQLFNYDSQGLPTQYGQEVLGPAVVRNEARAKAFAAESQSANVADYEHYLDEITSGADPEQALQTRMGAHRDMRYAMEELHSADPAAVMEASPLTDEAEELLANAGKGAPAFVTQNMRKILKENGFTDEVIDASTPDELLVSLRDKGRHVPESVEPMREVISGLRKEMDELPQREIAEGVKSKEWESFYSNYVTRYRFFFPNDKSIGGFDPSMLQTSHRSQKGRKEVLDMIGGSKMIDELSANGDFSGLVHSMKPSELEGKAGRAFWRKQRNKLEQHLRNQGYSEEFIATYKHKNKLVKWLAGLDPRHAAEKVGVFPHNPVHDIMKRVEYSQRSILNAQLIRKELSERVVPRGMEMPGDVRLDKVAKSFSGLDAKRTSELLAEKLGVSKEFAPPPSWDEFLNSHPALQEGGDAAGIDFTKEYDDLVEKTPKGIDTSGLKDFYVPKDIAEELHRLEESFRTPESFKTLTGKIIDPINKLWQASVTRAFPAFHLRNLVSGQFQNWVAGVWSPKAMRQSHMIMQGRYEDAKLSELPIFKGMSDHEAGVKLADMAFAHNLVSKTQGIGLEGLQGSSIDLDLAGQIPGVRPYSGFGATMGEYLPQVGKGKWGRAGGIQQLNPLNDEKFAPYQWGATAGGYIEGLNRLTPFINLLKKGYSPEQAAKRVMELQFDYSALTKFEKEGVKRAIPFWTYSKNEAKFAWDELTQRPGGRLAQAGVRLPNEARTEGEPLPEYLSQTASVKLGKLPSGSDRYLTGFGLGHEDPLSFLSVREGVPDVSDSIAELMSRTSPLIKYPVELATGESFFQRGPLGGREFVDMDPALGRLLTNIGLQDETASGRAKPFGSIGFENLLTNTPASRFLTTARVATDPRKREATGGLLDAFPGQALATNLLTGVKLSDISPAARDAILREEASAAMRARGARAYEDVVFTKAQVEEAAKEDPETAREMLKFNRLQRYLAEQSRKRKKEKEGKK